MFARYRADLGHSHARQSASREAANYAPARPVDDVLAELRQAWTVQQRDRDRLAHAVPVRDALGEIIPLLQTQDRELAAAQERCQQAGDAAMAAAERVTASSAALTEQARQLRDELQRAWDAEIGPACAAARTVLDGPGRLGLRLRSVNRGVEQLDAWSTTWQPYLPDMPTDTAAIAYYAQRAETPHGSRPRSATTPTPTARRPIPNRPTSSQLPRPPSKTSATPGSRCATPDTPMTGNSPATGVSPAPRTPSSGRTNSTTPSPLSRGTSPSRQQRSSASRANRLSQRSPPGSSSATTISGAPAIWPTAPRHASKPYGPPSKQRIAIVNQPGSPAPESNTSVTSLPSVTAAPASGDESAVTHQHQAAPIRKRRARGAFRRSYLHVISVVPPEARHAHKTVHRRQDGFKAHIAVEPDAGLITDCTLSKAAGADPHDSVIKPIPLRAAVPGGFTFDDFTVDHAAGTVTYPATVTRTITKTRKAVCGAACRECPLRSRCTTSRNGRILALHEPEALLRAARETPESWFAAQLDPARHLDHYLRDVSIAFELGGEDNHIPASNAQNFRRALIDRDPVAGDRIRVTIHDGLDHFGVTTDQPALQAAVEWLTSPHSNSGTRPV